MRTLLSLLLAGLMVIAILPACAARPSAQLAPTAIPASSAPSQPQRQPVLRVAILGDVTTTNVWVLFNDEGANYWNYATQNDYWPRLYRRSPFTQGLETAAAEGEIPPVVCDLETCTATVSLLPGLTWTDGSPLTAQDAAFTANTALRFQLGLTWREAYDPETLDHVEALNDTTVKYFFKTPPNVATWQYGILQGPIVNQTYWQPRIVEAIARLPDDTLAQSLQELQGQSLDMQAQVQRLGLSLNTMAPSSQVYRDTASQAAHIQEDLNSVNHKLEKVRAEYELKLTDARQALFSLGNTNEPTLGPWRFKDRIPGELENTVVLGSPLGDPWFDSVRYVTFDDELSAAQSLLADEVDVLLSPTGLSAQALARLNASSEVTITRSATRMARFLAFNHANPYLADTTLHRALACLLEPQDLIAHLNGEAIALTGFALEGYWRDTASILPCQGETEAARQQEAVRMLTAAGYTWETGPAQGSVPVGLKAPDGMILPSFTLLAPAQEYDSLRASAATYIAQQAQQLGIAMDVRLTDADSVIYAVYGSGEYDLALLGWQLSGYPAYLCEWFPPSGQNPFAYDGNRLKSACEAWSQATDLQLAQDHAYEVQSILMQDLPMIPLFLVVRYDAFRNVRYPFGAVIDGLSGVYAAPGLAVPIP
jgi:ABC-type transport system substrate-binding protein